MSKRIFIAATMQNDGKTTFSLGLMHVLAEHFKRIGFIKPVGQRYLIEQGYKVDEDSVLINEVCGIECNLNDMSPIAVERGFTERYIKRPNRQRLIERIKSSFAMVAKNSDLVIVEGTGHAGVGSVFDLSNAAVAKFLRSKVILIAGGGLGRPIDELMLNKALFDKEGVELIGVIINKVIPEKYKKINKLARLSLQSHGVKVLGVIPYSKILSIPSMEQIREEIDAEVLWGKERLCNLADNIIVAAMAPFDVLNYLRDRVLVIVPGDREDVITTILSSHLVGGKKDFEIVGIILTGGIIPHKQVMNIIERTDIPVLFSKEDTYRVSARVHDRIIKIRPEDKEKIEWAVKLTKDHVDLGAILKAL
ncbi:MAG: AAA family ATPase [Candidatus Omnitrophica bacterium]|nr:AAA family ATPase [Candidatus Omnitrophota bacterium]